MNVARAGFRGRQEGRAELNGGGAGDQAGENRPAGAHPTRRDDRHLAFRSVPEKSKK